MQIMHEKGLVTRDERERAHIYRPVVERSAAQRRLVGELLDGMFSGSASELLLQALSHRRASKAELAEIRRMLDDFERKQS